MSFGPVVSARALRIGVQALLEKWTPAVLAELVRRETGAAYGPKAWPAPRTYRRLPVDDDEAFALAGDQFPMVAVTSPGLSDDAERDGDGRHQAIWWIHAIVLVRGQTWDDTADRVGLYTASLRAAAVRERVPVDGAGRLRWARERYDAVGARDGRTLGAGVVTFRLPVGDVLDDDSGPLEPPAGPEFAWPDDPISDSASVDVVRLQSPEED